MKLTTVITLVATLQISASTYSQNTMMSVNVKNGTISDIIQAIEEQSEFKIFYKNDQIDLFRPVSVRAKEKPVSSILNEVLEGTDIKYTLLDKIIVLSPEERFDALNDQQIVVKGVVTDASNSPLPGVNIIVKGTTTGGITDVNGEYTISVPDANTTLIFSYVGYLTEEIDVNGQTTINLTMIEDIQSLEEVVVIGYGERMRKDITTSVASVSSEQIEKMSGISPELALQGTAPGVRIQSGGGSPYARNTINVRGVNTYGSASPLIVIDGVPMTEFGGGIEAIGSSSDAARNRDLRSPINVMSLINPNDIASISVLKDASAASIYGVRGANGVILIETKKGQEGKVNIEFSSRWGWKSVTKTYDVLDVDQYVELYQEAYANNTTATRPDVFDPTSTEYLGNMATTNWQDPYIKDNARSEEYNLTVSGATSTANYFLSAGYTYDEAPIVNNDLERYSIVSNVSSNVTSWLKAGLNFRGVYQTNNASSGGDVNNLSDLAGYAPWQPIYGDARSMGVNGYARAVVDSVRADDSFDPILLWGPATHHNQFALMSLNSTDYELYRGMGKMFLEIEPVKNLTIRGVFGGDFYTNRRDQWSDIDSYMFYQNPSDPLSAAEPGVDDTEGNYGERHNRNFNTLKEVIINYGNSFGNHNVMLTLSGSEQKYGWEVVSASSEQMKYADEQYRLVNAIDQEYDRGGTDKWESAIQGYMGRASYNYNHKYYLDGILRYDGSSKFDSEYRWDWFPGFSAAWRLSEENFMNSMAWLTDLKLRTGWGKTGNDEVSNYGFMSLAREFATVSLGSDGGGRFGGMGYTYWGASFDKMANQGIEWEKTYTTNIAFDAIMLNSLNLTVEYFYKKTTDLLASVQIPASLGYQQDPPDNFGTVVNKGIDLSLGYRGKVGEFNFHINGNFSYIHNEVTELSDGVPFGGNDNRVEEGYPLFYLYGYETDGILQSDAEVTEYLNTYTDASISEALLSPGDFRFKDTRGNPDVENRFYSPDPDGIINNYDQVMIGKTIPGYTYGFVFSANYKSFDLSAIFYGEGDVQRYNWARAGLEAMSGGGNNLTTTLNRWTPGNPSNELPRAVFGDPADNNRYSTRFVEDADYFRLSTLQLGFTLPLKAYDVIGFGENFRIWVGGSNLFTITDWSGLDPSVNESGGGVMPTPRVWNCGLNVKF